MLIIANPGCSPVCYNNYARQANAECKGVRCVYTCSSNATYTQYLNEVQTFVVNEHEQPMHICSEDVQAVVRHMAKMLTLSIYTHHLQLCNCVNQAMAM